MAEGLHALTDREKQALRLLLRGHDAKSIARELGLSVHTVNERLRDARRKVGAASSREAARRLAEAELEDPDFYADRSLGVAAAAPDRDHGAPSDRRRSAGLSLAWLAGGMLVMSLIVAAASLGLSVFGQSDPRSAAPPPGIAATAAPASTNSPGATAAASWLVLLDRQRWDESWNAAGTLFRTQLSKETWASTIQPLRRSFGAPSSRTIQDATTTTSLPGMPAGDYALLQFRTDFAHKPAVIESVTLVREGSGWKVIGYFVR